MSILAQPPPTPPSFDMTDNVESENISNKRKASDQDQAIPLIQQIHKDNLPDTPNSTVSNRISSSNSKDKKDAESPTVNKKSKNNPIIEKDRYNKIKFTSPPASFDKTRAYTAAALGIQEFVAEHQGVIEELDEDHFQFIALAVQGSESESKDLAKQIYEKVCDDSEMELDSQTDGELKPSEKLSIEVIVKAIEKVASRTNWGLEWEDIDDSVEKGEKIPINHKLARFQLWTWEVNDPTSHLPPKIASQVSSQTSLRSTSRALAIQMFKDLPEEERTAYLKNKPLAKGSSSKSKSNNNNNPKSDDSQEVEAKKGGEIKESSIPNTPVATGKKEKSEQSSSKEEENNEKTPAPSQKPKSRKSSGNSSKDAITIDSSDNEMDKDADGDISMKSTASKASSSSKKGKASRSASPTKRETSPTKGKGKKKELTEEEKAEKEKKEQEKKRKEKIKEEKKAKEEKKNQQIKSQKNLLAGFLVKGGDKSKSSSSSSSGSPFKVPSSSSKSNNNDNTPSSSGSKVQVGEPSNSPNEASTSSNSGSDFERAFLKFIPSARQEIAEINQFSKGKEVSPLDELFDQDIPQEDLLSQFKALNPNKFPRTVSRRQTRPRLVIKEVMSMVAESDAVGGQAALKAAKGLKDIQNPKKVWKKFLQFCENRRPAYHGTHTQPSSTVGPCYSWMTQDVALDYNYDSDDAWEDEPEDADEINDKDDGADDSASDAGSEDSWLVDDMDVDEEPVVPPQDDNDEDEIVVVDSKGVKLPKNSAVAVPQTNTLQAKKKKKPKQPTKLVPFTTGPHWELGPGLPSYSGFEPFQMELLNDAYYGVDPFSFVSKMKGGQTQIEDEDEAEEAGDTSRAGSGGISSFNSKGKGVTKKPQITQFPEAKMKELLTAIHEKPISKSEMVKSLLPRFKDYTTKAAFERVVTECTEKGGKGWIVKSELLTRYNIAVPDDSNFFSASPKKQSKPLQSDK